MLVILLGAVLIKERITGRFVYYVKPGFAPLLLVAGVSMLLIGAASLISNMVPTPRTDRSGGSVPLGDVSSGAEGPAAAVAGDGDGHDIHEHDHSRSRAPWLIMIPLLVLVLAPPPALGADAVVGDVGSQAVDGPATSGSAGRRVMQFDPLPPDPNPPMSLKEFALRALYDPQPTVSKRSVTVTGFIGYASDGYSTGYSIARLVISCCAADANPRLVHVSGEAPFPPNTWVTAVISAIPGSATDANLYVPTVKVTSIVQRDQPADPYLH